MDLLMKFKKRSIQSEAESDLQGQGIEKIVIPSNVFDICPRLEILLALKLSGHTNTLTEAISLIDELHIRGEIQNEQ